MAAKRRRRYREPVSWTQVHQSFAIFGIKLWPHQLAKAVREGRAVRLQRGLYRIGPKAKAGYK
jgi:hypothetical protein